MFCPYCGNRMVDSASFCTACGKQIVLAIETNLQEMSVQNTAEQQVQQYQLQKDAIRKGEIESLENTISHFSKKADQFKDYDYFCNRVNYYAQGASSALLAWGCIIASFSLMLMAILASENNTVDLPVVAIILLIPGLLMVAGGVIMKLCSCKKFQKSLEAYAQLSEELNEHYANYPNCPVGAEYTNPEILKQFLYTLQSGRADTIKESINLMVDPRHNSRIQEYLARTARNTAEVKGRRLFIPASFFK